MILTFILIVAVVVYVITLIKGVATELTNESYTLLAKINLSSIVMMILILGFMVIKDVR